MCSIEGNQTEIHLRHMYLLEIKMIHFSLYSSLRYAAKIFVMAVSRLPFHGILKKYICNVLTLKYDIDIICTNTRYCNWVFSKILKLVIPQFQLNYIEESFVAASTYYFKLKVTVIKFSQKDLLSRLAFLRSETSRNFTFR